jgi:hypothetical protein
MSLYIKFKRRIILYSISLLLPFVSVSICVRVRLLLKLLLASGASLVALLPFAYDCRLSLVRVEHDIVHLDIVGQRKEFFYIFLNLINGLLVGISVPN